MTQSEVAALSGLTRKTVLNAEKGKAQLEGLVAIMMALGLTDQLDRFIPKQDISPLQLARLQGKKRERASGRRSQNNNQDDASW